MYTYPYIPNQNQENIDEDEYGDLCDEFIFDPDNFFGEGDKFFYNKKLKI